MSVGGTGPLAEAQDTRHLSGLRRRRDLGRSGSAELGRPELPADIPPHRLARDLGIPGVPTSPWGTHFCQFYRTKQDLLEILVPYFWCGLEHNEFCMWVTCHPLTTPEAVAAMRASVPGFPRALRRGQIEIIPYTDWYLQDGRFDQDRVLAGWVAKLEAARVRGFDGLRLTGNTFWLEQGLWRDFSDYEDAINRVIGNYRMIALCTYSLERCTALEVIDVVNTHQFALVKRHDTWTLVEPSERKAVTEAIEKTNAALIQDPRSAQRYTRSLLEASPDPLVTISAAGKITDVNEATIRATGVPRDRLIGSDFASYFTEPGKASAGYRQAFHLGTVTDYPLVLRHVSGTTIDVHYNASVYRDSDGNVAGVFAAARDVTARNRAEASARRLAAIVESSDDAIIAKTLDGTVLTWNPGAQRLYGYPAEEMVGRSITMLVPPDRQEEWRDVMRRVARGEHVRHLETRRVPRQGPPLDISLSVSPILDSSGEVVGVSTIARDITERKQAEQQLQAASAYNRSLIEASLDPLVTIEPHGTITDVNTATEQITGFSRNELIGTEFSAYFTDPDLARAGYQRAFRNGTVRDYPLDLRHRDGHTTPVLYNASVYRNHAGQVLGVFAAARDITERKWAEEQLRHQASHDDLTGLPNRALLLEHLAGALARSQRTGSPVGVLFLDLDDFKSINDSYGHSAGDELLTQVASRIGAGVRASDVVARVGSDEFVIICENLKEPADAAFVAEQIQRALTRQIPLRGQSVTAGASVGIALSHPGSSPESMLRDADSAMYVAKTRGGRRWEPADESLQEAAIRVLAVESELHRALERRELRVYYQPLIDLATGAMVAVEALLRWQHPDRGLILPAEFVDVAEQRNIICDIGTWVLQTACAQAAAWQQQYGSAAPRLAVNVSSRQLDHRGISAQITKALDASQLHADQLFLEVTESQLLAADTSSASDLRTLADNGIRIAVDDFGTGYAGFDYLRRLPVHELKIDRSFVDGTGTDPADTAITASVVALGLNLGLTVVAEGIETTEQLHTLREMGCTWGQGWLWHPALPADGIAALLASR
jgi:diguanylate cyclase (GGDEF)-like protein/PAS domain S-box-containing protein